MKLQQIFTGYNIEPHIRFESDFGSVIMSLAGKEPGVSIVPFSYSYARHPGIRFIKLAFEVPLYLHWRKEEENAVIRNVLNLILKNQ